MIGLEVRPVAARDYPVWLPLWHAYQDFYQVSLPEAATRSSWSRMIDADEPVHGALAWESGRAVGLAHWIVHRSTWAEADDCYLNDLYVAPEQRRRGVARRLIEFASEAARRHGCGQIYWLTHETNRSAIALYERMAERTGFVDFRIRL